MSPKDQTKFNHFFGLGRSRLKRPPLYKTPVKLNEHRLPVVKRPLPGQKAFEFQS